MSTDDEYKLPPGSMAELETERLKVRRWLTDNLQGETSCQRADEAIFGSNVHLACNCAAIIFNAALEMNWPVSSVRSKIESVLNLALRDAFDVAEPDHAHDREFWLRAFRSRWSAAVKASDEWREIEDKLLELANYQADAEDGRAVEEPAAADAEETPSVQKDPVAAKRTAELDAYKTECAAADIRVTDKMIAEAASDKWHERTPVQRWKRNDPRCTPGDDMRIRAVLKRKPHLP